MTLMKGLNNRNSFIHMGYRSVASGMKTQIQKKLSKAKFYFSRRACYRQKVQ
jgi:hypothetical protein